MIKLSKFMSAVAAVLFASASFAACPYPDEIAIPDGSSSSEAEMVAGQKVVKGYMADMEAYLDCLDKEAKALGKAETPEQKALHTQRHNAAVEAMEQVAASFNEQIRAFKERDE